MKTRNIFIDTSIFISQNYNYKNDVFINLIRLTEIDRANLLTTDITIKEVESHIYSDVKKINQALSKFKKDAKVLGNTEVQFADEFDESKINDDLKAQFSQFLAQSKSIVLSISNVSIEKVFDKYFNKQAPFGDGKKKAEFPDAFVLESLESWCIEKDEDIYVVSQDSDLKAYCETSEKLNYLDDLAKFIDTVEYHDEVLAPAIHTIINKNIETIQKEIEKEFTNQGFWLDDQDGEVLNVEVTKTDIGDILLLKIDKDFAIIQLDVIIEYDADIAYDDPVTMIYSSKDNISISLDTIEETVQETTEFKMIIHIKHDIEKPLFFNIDSIKIDKDFSVSSDYGNIS